jgi:diguanylate cyclase (GGDEF)-like protein
VVGRIGGDEFAVLLQRADASAAAAKAQSLLDTVASTPVHFQHKYVAIGITFGVREIAAADSAEQALAEADANMYLRKPQKAVPDRP